MIPFDSFLLNSDHVFFFSYMQTEQKGSVLGMWSDASALAELNCMYKEQDEMTWVD